MLPWKQGNKSFDNYRVSPLYII